MAHYAFINNDRFVVEVITGVDENETVNGITGTEGWEEFYATQRPGLTCRRTSYHGNIRAHYAGIGYHYDDQADVFYPPQPFPSWTLDAQWNWQPPIPYPDNDNTYVWNEDTLTWVEVEP